MIEDREVQPSAESPHRRVKVHALGYVELPDQFSYCGVTWVRGGRHIKGLRINVPGDVWVAQCQCGYFLTCSCEEGEDEADYVHVDNRVYQHLKDCTLLGNARIDIRKFICDG